MNKFERTEPNETKNPNFNVEFTPSDFAILRKMNSGNDNGIAGMGAAARENGYPTHLEFCDPFIGAQGGNHNCGLERYGTATSGRDSAGANRDGSGINVGGDSPSKSLSRCGQSVTDITSSSGVLGNNPAIMKYFTDKGLTVEQAAGIVGNIDQESGADPNQSQYGGGPGFGLAQWEAGGRLENLQQFAASEGKPVSDLGTQLDFMWQELNTTESPALAALKGTTSASQAADVFEQAYERAGAPMLDNRESYAQQAISQYDPSETDCRQA